MKIKLFLLILISIGAFYLAADYLFIQFTRNTVREFAKNTASQSVSLYKYKNKADAVIEVREVEVLAKKPELLSAFNAEKWEAAVSESPYDISKITGDNLNAIKEIESNVQIELNVINKMYDKTEAIFVVDKYGNVVAKNLDGTLKNMNFSKEVLISAALQGAADRDIVKMLDKTFRITAAPIYINGKIAGAYCSADMINSETAKEVVAGLFDESIKNAGDFYFGFFDRKTLLGSTMPTELHENFKKFISEHQEMIEKIDSGDSKRHDTVISIKGEKFYASIAKHPSLSESNDVFYLTLVSMDKTLGPVSSKQGTLILISIFILILGLITIVVLDEQFNRPVNKFMENMLEIINGNVKYRFNNEATGVEGNLNQNANMMIATLLGEKIPDKEKDNDTNG